MMIRQVLLLGIWWLGTRVSVASLVEVFNTDGNGGTFQASDANSDNIADNGVITGTYSFGGLEADGVTFDLAFDIVAGNGYLNVDPTRTFADDEIGVWSNSTAESVASGRRDEVNAGESLTINHIVISNTSGGTVSFDGILRVGFGAAEGSNDQGQFTFSGGGSIEWDDLDDGDTYDLPEGIETGTSDSGYRLLNAYLGAGFTGPINSFTVSNVGTLSGSAWRLDAIEMQFSGAAVPEPSTFLFGGFVVMGVLAKKFFGGGRDWLR